MCKNMCILFHNFSCFAKFFRFSSLTLQAVPHLHSCSKRTLLQPNVLRFFLLDLLLYLRQLYADCGPQAWIKQIIFRWYNKKMICQSCSGCWSLRWWDHCGTWSLCWWLLDCKATVKLPSPAYLFQTMGDIYTTSACCLYYRRLPVHKDLTDVHLVFSYTFLSYCWCTVCIFFVPNVWLRM